MKLLLKLCVLSVLVLTGGQSLAQTWPARPVRIIIAFAPGGPLEIVRPVAQKLSEALGQPFVIDYKPGANSMIGADFVLKAPADGYTLLTVTSSLTINPSTQKNLAFDALRDFTPVSFLARGDIILTVNPALPVKNVKELVALAKSQPGKLSFASSGTGGSLHLAGELLKVLTGIEMTHIPYKGAGPATADVVAGNANLAFLSMPPSVPMIKAGKLRIIGVASLKRTSTFPDVPTIDEQGLAKFEVVSFYGMVVRAAVPRPVINRLDESMQKILAMDDIRQAFNNSGVEPWYLPQREQQPWLEQEIDKWQKVTRAIKYQPE
jgi:tripartite-type tricarboxylate transporter receptor subunit TctC